MNLTHFIKAPSQARIVEVHDGLGQVEAVDVTVSCACDYDLLADAGQAVDELRTFDLIRKVELCVERSRIKNCSEFLLCNKPQHLSSIPMLWMKDCTYFSRQINSNLAIFITQLML